MVININFTNISTCKCKTTMCKDTLGDCVLINKKLDLL